MTIAYEAPRNGSGISGSGGKCRMFAHVISSSGNVGSSSRHVWSTSAARSNGKNSAPA